MSYGAAGAMPTREEFEGMLSGLSVRERRGLEAGLKGGPVAAPFEGTQRMAFESKADVTGFGGAASGGKSALLALLAVLSHRRTVVYRSDQKQCGQIMDSVEEFLGGDCQVNRQAGLVKFGEGKHVEFAGLGKPNYLVARRGKEFDLLCVDEATEVPEAHVRFVMSWNRSPVKGQRVRTVLGFNPPGGPTDAPDGDWVVEWFAPWLDERHPNPAQPGELRWFVRTGEEDEDGPRTVEVAGPASREIVLGGKRVVVKPESRTFVPSTYMDNPYMGEEYGSKLSQGDDRYRLQLMLGEFRSGMSDDPEQVLPTRWVDEAMERWEPGGHGGEPMDALGFDVAMGGKDYSVCVGRHGWWWSRLKRKPGHETPDGQAAAAFAAGNVRDGAPVCIDEVSWGASARDQLGPKGMKLPLVCVNGQRKASSMFGVVDPGLEMQNLRSALWWIFRRLLEPSSGLSPALPKDNRLRKDLVSVKYFRRGNRICVEAKEDLVKRIGHSTDDADAVLTTLCNMQGTPGFSRLLGAGGGADAAEAARRMYGGGAAMRGKQRGGRNAYRAGGGWMRG